MTRTTSHAKHIFCHAHPCTGILAFLRVDEGSAVLCCAVHSHFKDLLRHSSTGCCLLWVAGSECCRRLRPCVVPGEVGDDYGPDGIRHALVPCWRCRLLLFKGCRPCRRPRDSTAACARQKAMVQVTTTEIPRPVQASHGRTLGAKRCL